MFAFIHNLKSKPTDVRNRAAIFIAISFTVLIVGIWFMVVKNEKTDEEVQTKSMREEIKPLMMIFGKAGKGFSEIKENISNTKKEN